MSAFDLILVVMLVASAAIAIMAPVKGWPLWVSNLLLTIIVALMLGARGHIG